MKIFEKLKKILKKDEKEKKEEEILEEGKLLVNVYQVGNEIFVEAPLGGVKLEDLKISVENGGKILKIAGERKERKIDGEYLLKECYFGRFFRNLVLPFLVKDKFEAKIEDGILKIKLFLKEK
jgi:HSP20 family molecular chaperone IbpA